MNGLEEVAETCDLLLPCSIVKPNRSGTRPNRQPQRIHLFDHWEYHFSKQMWQSLNFGELLKL